MAPFLKFQTPRSEVLAAPVSTAHASDPLAWVDDYEKPGDFIKAFLQFGGDDDGSDDDPCSGEQATAHLGDHCSRARSRSRSRSHPKPQAKRMPKAAAAARTAAPHSKPLPKKMPRSRTTSTSGPPATLGIQPIEEPSPLPTPRGRPQQTPWPRAMLSAPMVSQASASDPQRPAVAVLARHAARLGGMAGQNLETAVQTVISRGHLLSPRPALEAAVLAGRFDFLNSQSSYSGVKADFAKVYREHGPRRPETDQFVRSMSPTAGLGNSMVPPLPAPSLHGLRYIFAEPGTTIELAPEEVGFGHDAQYELFGGARDGAEPRSILQTAVEIASGLTPVEALPAFTVCRHESRWYCRTGNRRLAALRVARRFRPERCGRLRVTVVPADDGFLHGTWNRGPKLTTQRNGIDCCGRWLVVRETGEAVGWEDPDCAEYGSDLMALLFSF